MTGVGMFVLSVNQRRCIFSCPFNLYRFFFLFYKNFPPFIVDPPSCRPFLFLPIPTDVTLGTYQIVFTTRLSFVMVLRFRRTQKIGFPNPSFLLYLSSLFVLVRNLVIKSVGSAVVLGDFSSDFVSNDPG